MKWSWLPGLHSQSNSNRYYTLQTWRNYNTAHSCTDISQITQTKADEPKCMSLRLSAIQNSLQYETTKLGGGDKPYITSQNWITMRCHDRYSHRYKEQRESRQYYRQSRFWPNNSPVCKSAAGPAELHCGPPQLQSSRGTIALLRIDMLLFLIITGMP
jgi:hypothetical protein